MKAAILATVVATTIALIGCSPSVDVVKSVRVESVSTGWNAVATQTGNHKVVPLASLTLKNVSAQALPSLQVNAVFHRRGENAEWGTAFVSAAGSTGLGPGEAAHVTVRSELGYTGTDPTDALLTNSHFVDATVDVFAKVGSTQWARVGEFPIERQLLRP